METLLNSNTRICTHSVVWDISLELLLIFSATVCNTAIFFLFGLSASSYHFVGAVFITFAVMRFLRQGEIQRTVWTLCAAVAIILVLCAISGAVYDTTWDGAAYHKQAVGLLHSGWNPVYQSADYYESLAHTIPYTAENPLKWAETYPKASWYFASVIYYIFNNIEAGKAYTLIFMLITGGFFYDYCRARRLHPTVCIVTAILASLNPISVAQCQSYYLDGLACSVAMCLLLLMIRSFSGEGGGLSTREHTVAAVALLIVGCNLKFSILLLCVVYCVVYIACCGVLYVKKKCAFRSLLVRFGVLSGGGIFSTLVIGASPYITNYHRYGNIFGSFLALLTPDVTANSGFADTSNFKFLLLSLFGKMSHGEFSSEEELLKLPFTIFPSELTYYTYVDTRLGGMGALFSGVLTLSFLLLGVLIFYCISKRKSISIPDWVALFIVFCISNALYAVFLPLTFQLRYVGFIYFFPVFLPIVSLQIVDHEAGKKVLTLCRVLSGLICLTTVLNMLPWFGAHILRINRSIDTRTTLRMLQEQHLDEQQLQIAIYCKDFTGIHYNLREDFGLEYGYVDFEEIGELGGFIPTFSDWVYYRIVDAADAVSGK